LRKFAVVADFSKECGKVNRRVRYYYHKKKTQRKEMVTAMLVRRNSGKEETKKRGLKGKLSKDFSPIHLEYFLFS